MFKEKTSKREFYKGYCEITWHPKKEYITVRLANIEQCKKEDLKLHKY